MPTAWTRCAFPLPLSVPPEELIADRDNGGPDSPEEHESKFAWKADFYINIDYSRINGTLCDAAGATDIQYIRTAGRTTPTPAQCALIFQADSNKWWESREQTFVDEITIDYAQLFNWMALVESNQSSILYITVRNIPGVSETYPAGARCPSAACTFRPYPVLRIVNASVLGPAVHHRHEPAGLCARQLQLHRQLAAIRHRRRCLHLVVTGSFSTAGILNRPGGAGVSTGGVTRWT